MLQHFSHDSSQTTSEYTEQIWRKIRKNTKLFMLTNRFDPSSSSKFQDATEIQQKSSVEEHSEQF